MPPVSSAGLFLRNDKGLTMKRVREPHSSSRFLASAAAAGTPVTWSLLASSRASRQARRKWWTSRWTSRKCVKTGSLKTISRRPNGKQTGNACVCWTEREFDSTHAKLASLCTKCSILSPPPPRSLSLSPFLSSLSDHGASWRLHDLLTFTWGRSKELHQTSWNLF